MKTKFYLPISLVLSLLAFSYSQAANLEIIKVIGGYEKKLGVGRITSIEIDEFDGKNFLTVKSKENHKISKTDGSTNTTYWSSHIDEIQCKISEKVAADKLNFSLKELFGLLNQTLLSETSSTKHRFTLRCYNGKVDTIFSEHQELISTKPDTIDLFNSEVLDYSPISNSNKEIHFNYDELKLLK